MIPQKRKYFVILVHHGNRAPTDSLVSSLQNGEEAPEKVIIVDHSHQEYSHQSQDVRVIRPKANNGYAAGLNTGLGALLSLGGQANDVIICLNNDLQLEPSFLSTVKSWWDKHDGSILMSNKGGYVDLVTGRSHITSNKKPDTWSTLSYLHGSCLIASFKTFMAMQGLPEEFFLYWEDVAISRKATQKDILLKVKDLPVHHNDEVKNTYTDDHLYYLVRNGALFLQTSTPLPWRMWWRIVNQARLAYHSIRPQKRQVPVIREALKDAASGKDGARS